MPQYLNYTILSQPVKPFFTLLTTKNVKNREISPFFTLFRCFSPVATA